MREMLDWIAMEISDNRTLCLIWFLAVFTMMVVA